MPKNSCKDTDGATNYERCTVRGIREDAARAVMYNLKCIFGCNRMENQKYKGFGCYKEVSLGVTWIEERLKRGEDCNGW